MGSLFLSTSLQVLSLLPPSRLRGIRCSKEDLKGQRVAVIGLGISGKAATRLALARGASVLAVDGNEQLIPLEYEPEFAEFTNLQTILGDCDIAQLEHADRIVVSPGVPLEEYAISALMKSGRNVMSELDFAAEILPPSVKVLAVSGTNGKSTVTSFAGQMLDHLGIKAFVGGNFGKPLSEAAILCLNSSSVEDIYQAAVVEVSSYQMEIPSKYFSPSVAVILNLTPDHLDRHKTMQNYADIKCNLFSHMKDDKLALLPIGNPYLNKAFSKHANGCHLTWIGDFPGIKIDMEAKVAKLKFPTTDTIAHLQLSDLRATGAHNYTNAAVAAFLVLGLGVGVDYHSINSIVKRLTLLPHRIQVVCTDACGIRWVDDSKATNIESTYTALLSLKDQKSIVLLGGLAKVLNGEDSNGFEQLVELLQHRRAVITFGSSGEMIYRALCDGGLSIPCIRAKNLEDAVKHAKSIAVKGDVILLSPGCASFDEFRNFEHRGRAFQELALSS
ncbi:uncharacterized protein LOC110103225 isoform X1 [Dendrobium catenatum]|uniref:Uncharacterized protein n=1 Tax=Dendrobium catenatum TaxID=906689 RepID=A0A2I0W430_9ASPA|nr:uncharacterized protein LOC110103225 isoform X1 [Dendrobium catenatum]PKU70421.1 hypothetical protein MA16_Dca007173 [Dendrobium catenatum]